MLLAGVALCFGAATAQAADKIPKAIAGAVADAGRPDADKQRDANRKPAEVVAFAGIKPGQKVLDLLPGGGYFTRIFAKTVGAKGEVYALVPDSIVAARPKAADAVNAIAADKAYGNVKVLVQPLASLKTPAPVDVVWTSDNYHDLKNQMFGPADTAAMNKAIFAALKPGGTYIVLDHAAAAGSGTRDTETLHRIDPAVVKAEVTAAGFVFAGESDVLHNAADDHTIKVVDGTIRGKTDQFVYKFTKPKK
jgi:predicted methyltransferase